MVSANTASLSRPQAEPSVASNPQNRHEMVAGYADAVVDVIPGVSRTVDGGAHWSAPTGGALLPNPPGFVWGDRTSVGHLAGGDSAVAWGLGDTAYFATLGFQDNSNPPKAGVCNKGGLYVYESTDGGNTWTLPAGGPLAANTQTVFRDKDYIAVDSNPASTHAGNVYAAWSDDVYKGCPQHFATNFDHRSIMFSRSADGGVTWSPAIELATGCLEAVLPAVGKDGSVYVTWYDCNSGNRQQVRKSIDGGTTFGAVVSAASGFSSCPNPLPGASFRVNEPVPVIATDPSDQAKVYVTWSSCTATSQADVFFTRSTNGGTTWSAPLRVNDDATNNPRDQFFPWMAVDDGGVVRIMWGDDRLDTVNPGGHNYDIFSAQSTNSGASFSANERVTTQSSDPDVDYGGTFIGDYFGMAPCGTPVWDDTRNGNQDIFGAATDENGDGTADLCTAPTIAGFSPTAATVGRSVTVTGTALTTATSVKFNGITATFSVASDTQISAKVPSGALTGPISVTTRYGTASSTSFKVKPKIRSFTPTSGPIGTTVTITGTAFTGATKVTFNGTSATYTVNSYSKITATVPAGASTGPIAVITRGGKRTTKTDFTVT